MVTAVFLKLSVVVCGLAGCDDHFSKVYNLFFGTENIMTLIPL